MHLNVPHVIVRMSKMRKRNISLVFAMVPYKKECKLPHALSSNDEKVENQKNCKLEI